jgi:hypothetical protein
VIDEREVADGLLESTARQPLEADIWCRWRIPQQEQFNRIREMVRKVRSSEIANDHSPETTFVADLLQAVGPQRAQGTGPR